MPTNVLNATVLTASGQPVQFTQGGPQKLIVTQHAGGQPRLIVPAQQVALLSNGTVSTTHGAAPGGATIGQLKPSLKIWTAKAICWNSLGLFRDYGLNNIFLGI